MAYRYLSPWIPLTYLVFFAGGGVVWCLGISWLFLLIDVGSASLFTQFFFSFHPGALKQTYKSFLFLSETMDIFCRAGSVQQAQQSNHQPVAEGLNPL